MKRNGTGKWIGVIIVVMVLCLSGGVAMADNPVVIKMQDNKLMKGNAEWTGDNWLTLETGSYELGSDITLGKPIHLGDPAEVTLDLKGHKIDRGLTEAVDDGYVLYIGSGRTLTLKATGGGTITGGYNSGNGGGVFIEGGTFTMEGGTITGNKSTWDGGGVLVSSSGQFYMRGGTISNNHANGNYTGGGGVLINGGSFTMESGGSIEKNTSGRSGGGVSIANGAFKISGGSITGNTASGYGGGIYSAGNLTTTISGNPIISGNKTGTGENAADSNLHLSYNATITIGGKLTNATPIGLTMYTPGVFTSGLSGKGTAANFTSDSSDYDVFLSGGGEAQLGCTVTFDGNGAESGNMENQTIKKRTDTLSKNAFTLSAHTFSHWNTAKNGSGTSYEDKAAANVIGDCTLYAQWRLNDFSIEEIRSTIYTAGNQPPTLSVKDKDTAAGLKEGTDYSVAWTKDGTAVTEFVNAGVYTVTVTGIGEYLEAEKKTATYTIKPIGVVLTSKSDIATYDGTAKTVTGFESSVIGLTFSGVSAAVSATDAGTYDVAFTGVETGKTLDATGNYQVVELVTGTLTIQPKEAGLSWADETFIYNGKEQAPAAAATGLVASDEGKVSVTVSGAVNAGTQTATATGLTGDRGGNYKLPAVNMTTFTIQPKSITGAAVSLDKTQLSWTGSEQSVNVTGVVIDGLTLKADDYIVTGNTGTDLNEYTLTVTGKGNFKDTATTKWKIVEKAMTVSVESVTVPYDGQPHGITVNVTDPATGAITKYGTTEGTYDFDASPTITDAGTMTVFFKVTAENYGDYTGSAIVTVTKADSAVTTIPAAKTGLTENGTPQELITAGTSEGGTMQYALGADAVTAPAEGWSEAIPTATDAGTYYVWYKVVGDVNHNDSVLACVTAEIKKEDPPTPQPVSISGAKISIDPQEYTGKAVKPKLTVKVNGKTLKANTDYTVTFKNNKNIGKATATITGIGNYTGTKTATFSIVPKKISSASLKYRKKDNVLVFSWKKAAGIDGYEIEYGTDKHFKGAKKAKVSAKEKKTEYKIEKPTKKKTWYVRIRAWKKVKGKKYYSEWKVVSKKVK